MPAIDLTHAKYFFSTVWDGQPADETNQVVLKHLAEIRTLQEALLNSNESNNLIRGLNQFLTTMADYMVKTEVCRIQNKLLLLKVEQFNNQVTETINKIVTRLPTRVVEGFSFEDLEKVAKMNGLDLIPTDGEIAIPIEKLTPPKINITVNYPGVSKQTTADIIQQLTDAMKLGPPPGSVKMSNIGIPPSIGSDLVENQDESILTKFPTLHVVKATPLPDSIIRKVMRLDAMLTTNRRPELIRSEMHALRQELHSLGVSVLDISAIEQEIYADTAHAQFRRP